MDILDRSFAEILSSQMVSIIGGIIAGTLLAVYIDKVLLLPGMRILLPGFLEMRGNISGSLSSRLSSGLFLGAVDKRRMWSKITNGNIIASFILVIVVSFALGLLAFSFNLLALGVLTPELIAISVVAAIMANAIEIPLTLFFTFYLFRRGHDPNNVMGPFVTSTGDITSIIALLIALAAI